MGGIWGIGASLAFETIKSEKRGFVSGLMQSGYATGYLGASLVFGFFYSLHRLARPVHGRPSARRVPDRLYLADGDGIAGP